MGTEAVPGTALELRYRKLVETLPSSVVFVLDRSLAVTFAGGGLVAKSTFFPAAYLQHPVRDIVPPAIFASVAPLLSPYTFRSGTLVVSIQALLPSGRMLCSSRLIMGCSW